KRKFMTRLSSDGITVSDREMRIISLSPHASPKVYALGHSWDTGGLFLGNDRLCYIGDHVRFTLKREQVLCVRLGKGVPDWIGEPRTYIEWQAESGQPAKIWNLLPKDPFTVMGNKRQCIEFAAELERWRAQKGNYPDVPPTFESLPLPELSDITNHP